MGGGVCGCVVLRVRATRCYIIIISKSKATLGDAWLGPHLAEMPEGGPPHRHRHIPNNSGQDRSSRSRNRNNSMSRIDFREGRAAGRPPLQHDLLLSMT